MVSPRFFVLGALLLLIMILGIVYRAQNSHYSISSSESNSNSNSHSDSMNSFNNIHHMDSDNFSLDSTGTADSHRKLSTDFNYFTGQSQNTYNGRVPKVTCSPGFYRPQGSTDLIMVSGQREDGCVPCPAGRYGAVSGLLSALCSGPCPLGTYSDKTGLTSASQCAFCPVGKYGQFGGLATKDCTGTCSAGKYTSTVGNVYKTDCKTCPPGFRSWQCIWAVAPMQGEIQDHLRSGGGASKPGILGPFGYKPGQQDPLPQGG